MWRQTAALPRREGARRPEELQGEKVKRTFRAGTLDTQRLPNSSGADTRISIVGPVRFDGLVIDRDLTAGLDRPDKPKNDLDLPLRGKV